MAKLENALQHGQPPERDENQIRKEKRLKLAEKHFRKLDSDGDGRLKFAEMKALLKILNTALTEEELKKLFDEADTDSSGSVNFKEFAVAFEAFSGSAGVRTRGGDSVAFAGWLQLPILESGAVLPVHLELEQGGEDGTWRMAVGREWRALARGSVEVCAEWSAGGAPGGLEAGSAFELEWVTRSLREDPLKVGDQVYYVSEYDTEGFGRVVALEPLEVSTDEAPHKTKSVDLPHLSLQGEVAEDGSGSIEGSVACPHGAEEAGCFKLLPASAVDALSMGSAEHVSMVESNFPFGAYIDATALRGITLAQLQRINRFACERCAAWTDTAPPEYSKTAGFALSMEFLNLYHLNSWLIMPATKAKNCAFVELLAAGPQQPSWFCSHWWGERIADFQKCVSLHVRLRRITDAAFWVCAFANRQHALSQELVKDPRETSFFKALSLSRGVLLILDDKTDLSGPATAFSRIWCAFEAYLAFERKSQDTEDEPGSAATSGILFDIAVCHQGGANLLADGPTADDTEKGENWAGGGTGTKAGRETFFPVDLIRSGLGLRLEEAQASNEDDRSHILNTFAGQPLDLRPPLKTHDSYDKVNRRLRATFASRAWSAAHVKGLVADLGLPDILKCGDDTTDLCFNFSCLDFKDADVPHLLRGLPAGLKTLTLSFRFCRGLGDGSAEALSKALPQDLEVLNLSMDNTGVTDIGYAAIFGNLPPNLRTFTFEETCDKMGDAGLAAFRFPAPLEKLMMRVSTISPAAAREFTARVPATLKSLDFDMFCIQHHKESVKPLFEALSERLPDLKSTYCEMHDMVFD